MKSKISFFNTCIYQKNVKLFWPVWLGYWIVLTLVMPVRMWLEFKQTSDSIIFYGQEFESEYIRNIYNSISMGYHIILITIVVIACAICVFGYLFNSRNANMMHAFPVNRLELFCTNVVSGLSFIWVPQVICFFTAMIVCISFGETRVIYLGIWLVMVMAISFFLFGVATLSAMCTGHTFATPVIFAIFGLGYIAIRYAITGVIEYFAFGVNNLSDITRGKINWLSPLYYIYENVEFNLVRDQKNEHVIGMEYSGMGIIASFFVIGIIVYVIAFILYKKRQIECAGDVVTFDIVKPVFRWGIGIIGGFIGTLLAYNMLDATGINISDMFFFVTAIILGVILFFISDMFIQKSFRVITKRRTRECIIYVGCFMLVLLSLKITGDIIEKNVPDNTDVKYVYINSTYPVKIDGDEISDIIALQNQIIDNEKYFRKVKSNYFREIRFRYALKNGNTLERTYSVPLTDKSIKLVYEQVHEYEADADNMKKYALCYDIKKCLGRTTGGNITVACIKTENTGRVALNDKQSALILKGLIKDIEEGYFQEVFSPDPAKIPMKKYDDGTYIVPDDSDVEYSYWLDMEFILNDFNDYMDANIDMSSTFKDGNSNISYVKGVEYYGDYTSIYQNVLQKSFCIDETCINTIQALIDAGVVKDINDLHNISERNE